MLPPGYRRNEVHKINTAPGAPLYHPVDDPLDAPWESLRDCIAKKATKVYANATTLLVYYDIGIWAFVDWDIPFHLRLFGENERRAFVTNSAFERIFVLSANMKFLVQLSPSPLVIIPEPSIYDSAV